MGVGGEVRQMFAEKCHWLGWHVASAWEHCQHTPKHTHCTHTQITLASKKSGSHFNACTWIRTNTLPANLHSQSPPLDCNFLLLSTGDHDSGECNPAVIPEGVASLSRSANKHWRVDPVPLPVSNNPLLSHCFWGKAKNYERLEMEQSQRCSSFFRGLKLFECRRRWNELDGVQERLEIQGSSGFIGCLNIKLPLVVGISTRGNI